MFKWIDRIRSRRRRRQRILDSDFGRRSGWDIIEGGVVIGQLEYMRWDSHGQFWHEYRVLPSGLDLVIHDQHTQRHWWRGDIVLRSRLNPGFSSTEFIATVRGDDVVAIRGLHLPEEYFTEEE